jgi:hypothetical protein
MPSIRICPAFPIVGVAQFQGYDGTQITAR